MSLRQSAANLLRRFRISSSPKIPKNHLTAAGSTKIIVQRDFEHRHDWSRRNGDAFRWIFLSGQAAIILGMNVTPALAEDVSVEMSTENDTSGATTTGLLKIEDGSVVSNIHTSKWRVFTDTGRDLFLQGKLQEAEKLFLSALKEAKEGFGERDAHVASACNNLAELYRVKKEFDKAEPLYLEAISILEESFGPDDVRVGAALHNLGQFYLAQRKLEQARVCYERALKIKRRVLGEAHLDYADTMYHLGTVLYLQGKENDSEALIQDSIRILEQAGQGESTRCIKRMQYLAQIYLKSNKIAEAEKILRRILHLVELSKGWDSLDTVVAAERLALTLQSAGSLREAEELLERCLAARKTLLPEDHIQNAVNMLYIARVKMLKVNQLRKTDISQAMTELEKAKALLRNSIRVAQQVLVQSNKQKGMKQSGAESRRIGKHGHWAMMILLQSFNALGLLETTIMELQESREDHLPIVEDTLRQCISAYKEFEAVKPVSDSPEVKAEYLSCLKHLHDLLSDNINASVQQPKKAALKELKDEIKHVETEIAAMRRRRG